MTMNNHPITPPPELVQQWRKGAPANAAVNNAYERHIATQAARWGADQELEACCEWLISNQNPRWAAALQEARRPKPPSLKELNLKHLDAIQRDGHYLPEIIADLRRAIESLPD